MISRYALLVAILYLGHLQKLLLGVALDSVYTSFRSGSRWSARPKSIFFKVLLRAFGRVFKGQLLFLLCLKWLFFPAHVFCPYCSEICKYLDALGVNLVAINVLE
jgi:hypothetical protein